MPLPGRRARLAWPGIATTATSIRTTLGEPDPGRSLGAVAPSGLSPQWDATERLVGRPIHHRSGGALCPGDADVQRSRRQHPRCSSLFHYQMNGPAWPEAQPWEDYIFALLAAVVVLLNRRAMLTREGAATEILAPGAEVINARQNHLPRPPRRPCLAWLRRDGMRSAIHHCALWPRFSVPAPWRVETM